MIIKDREYKTCPVCGHRKLISHAVLGCDWCGKALQDTALTLTVFFADDNDRNYIFCSWPCVFKKLRELNTDYFITLPYLEAEYIEDFWRAVKEIADEL